MCGIVGVLSDDRLPDRAQQRAALAALAHRGPDGRGSFTSPDGRLFLGHTRLAVIAPADGKQPLSNEDGRVVAVVNGEFYGYDHLRRSLEQRGHRFRGRCDSELLPHLYEEHGLDFVHHLRGEFAFAIWDERARRLIAGRDRFGIKPLLYAEHQHGLYLASEAKALFALGLPAAWDQEALEHALCHQYLPPSRSLFQGVRTLPPGHLLIAEVGAPPRLLRYWDLDLPRQVGPTDEQAAIAAVRESLDEAVRLRLRADVPVAFHLSGGLDSAAILALAARASAGQLHAFTVAFQHPPYGEGEQARAVAAALGVQLHAVEVGQEDLRDALSDAVYHGEGLCINGQLPSKLLLARAIAAAGFKVALSGEGADEAFLGYAHLAADQAQADDSVSPPGQAEVAQGGVMLPGMDAPALPELQSLLGFTPTFLRAKAAFGSQLLGLLRAEVATEGLRQRVFGRLFAELDLPGQLHGSPPVLQSAYLWTRLCLAGYILRALGDGTEMAASIEGRPPFLDHLLFERASALPIDLKLRGAVQKHVLREAVRDLLPAAVLARTKHPFLAPPLMRFGTPVTRAWILDVLASSAAQRLPLLDPVKLRGYAERCLAQGAAVDNSAEAVLMTLLSATLLQERFKLAEGGR